MDDRALYERQRWDTPVSWALFQIYLAQDPPRSLLRAYNAYREARIRAKQGPDVKVEPKPRVPGSFRYLAAGKRRDGTPIDGAVPFTLRVQAYEDYLANLERDKWTGRRLELREKEWNISSRILAKTEDMLLFPVMIQETVLNEDGTTQVIMPAGWSFKDIPGMLQTASKIARLAAELHTSQVKLDWRAEAEKEGINPDEIYRDLVKRFTDSMDGASATGGLPGGQEDNEGETGQAG